MTPEEQRDYMLKEEAKKEDVRARKRLAYATMSPEKKEALKQRQAAARARLTPEQKAEYAARHQKTTRDTARQRRWEENTKGMTDAEKAEYAEYLNLRNLRRSMPSMEEIRKALELG